MPDSFKRGVGSNFTPNFHSNLKSGFTRDSESYFKSSLKPDSKSSPSSTFVDDFLHKIRSDKCLTYELSPDKSGSVERLVNKIIDNGLHKRFFKGDSSHEPSLEIDAFVCTDSPLAILRQSATLASIRLQERLGKPIICTISGRDRNSLALSGEIMGLNGFDVRLFLALSGDPVRLGDQPQAKGVFELNSVGIIELIHRLNSGTDLNGKALKQNLAPIYPFSVINSYAKNDEILRNKMENKIRAGAMALFTQPVYDVDVAMRLLEWLELFNARHHKNCVLMLGFFPVLRYKSALFLHDKLPGVFIPELWLERLKNAKSPESEREIGIEMSLELFIWLHEKYPKIHFMNNNNVSVAKFILQGLF